jgi:hypothetical protein
LVVAKPGRCCRPTRGRRRHACDLIASVTDFEALAAAYYDHDDMRELFAMLVDDDPDVVDEGWEELEPSLMLDGEVFESSAAAVPRLLEVAAAARHRRAYALTWVGGLADGFGEHAEVVRGAIMAYAARVADFRNDPDSDVCAAARDLLRRIS